MDRFGVFSDTDRHGAEFRGISTVEETDLVITLLTREHGGGEFQGFDLTRDQWEGIRAKIDAEFAKVTPVITDEKFAEYVAIRERIKAIESLDTDKIAETGGDWALWRSLDSEHDNLSSKAMFYRRRYGANLDEKYSEYLKTKNVQST